MGNKLIFNAENTNKTIKDLLNFIKIILNLNWGK